MSEVAQKITQYVIMFARNPSMPTKVLLVHKNKPAWQAGRFNLPGGKIEQGETPCEAAVRELLEETGLSVLGQPLHLGVIEGTGCIIHVFTGLIDEYAYLEPQEGNTERVEWMDWPAVQCDRRLIENLRCIIPLCQAGVMGWTVRDTNQDAQPGSYRIEVIL